MKTRNEKMNVRLLALAVRCALVTTIALPLSAYAADDADALTKPTRSVDFGALYSSENSARFGQYNGLNTRDFMVWVALMCVAEMATTVTKTAHCAGS